MESIIIWAAQTIAEFGFNKLLDKVFDNKESFSNYLYNIISDTIDDYQKKFPAQDLEGKFSFYKSQIIIEELLKYRLFGKKGYVINESHIQAALEKNTNIQKPTSDELEEFFEIFDGKIKNDEKLKQIEIEEFHKEKIFEIFDKVEEILSFLRINQIELYGLLEAEYFEEVNDCFLDIKALNPKSALKRLVNIETRMEKNSKYISDNLRAKLFFIKAICVELNGKAKDSYELFIQAYKLCPENSNYLNRACISYYYLKDNRYKELKSIIETKEDYDTVCWAINTFESQDIIEYLQNDVPKNVLEKHRFKRLILNFNLKENKVNNNIALLEKLEVLKIQKDLPDLIDYDNLFHWIFILNSTSITFFHKTPTPFVGNLNRDEESVYFLHLSKVLTTAINDSELDNSFINIVFIYYWLESELEHNHKTIDLLKEAYLKLKEKDSFRTTLFAIAVLKHTGFSQAIEIIDNYSGERDENLNSLKTFCILNLNEENEAFIEYFSSIKEVDNLNIQNICSFLIPKNSLDKTKSEKILELMEQKNIQNKPYENLLKLLTLTYSTEKSTIELGEIDSLRDDLNKEKQLYFFVSLIYFENRYFEDCSKFIKTYLTEDVESRDLFFYIRALDSHRESNQLELLRVLKLWRVKFTFNDYFIRIELEIRQILKDWDEIILITKNALQIMPDDELFFTLYLIALNIKKQEEEILEQVGKATNFLFQASENAIRVAGIFIEHKKFQEGLEIIYKKAQNSSDSIARINYFTATVDFPQEFFLEEEIAVEGSYVKLEINGQSETIIADPKNTQNPIISQPVGRRKNDTFILGSSLSKNLKQVKIIRIMNKYLALMDEILTEASSSFSSLPVESITFEGKDKASIEKTFIENFGPLEAERKKHTDRNLKDYYSYITSFTELVIANFGGEYIDAYYYLTSPQGDGFCIPPNRSLSNKFQDEYENMVIDFSSALLFFELANELDINFSGFVFSESSIVAIDNAIAKTEYLRNSNMSISIHESRIIPHFYDSTFVDKRIKFLNDIKDWILCNSRIIIPEERIDIMRSLKGKDKVSYSFECFIDNSLLAQRDGYILITDDLSISKFSHLKDKFTSTETFLLKKFPTRRNELLEYLLRRRYIGLTLNKDVITNAYINRHKAGNEHVYNYVLRNLSLKQNFNPFNIFAVVEFLKSLALNPVITYEKFQSDTINIFVMLISSFPNPSYSLVLKKRLDQKFRLLGVYHDLVLKSLLEALRILNRNMA